MNVLGVSEGTPDFQKAAREAAPERGVLRPDDMQKGENGMAEYRL